MLWGELWAGLRGHRELECLVLVLWETDLEVEGWEPNKIQVGKKNNVRVGKTWEIC